MRKPLLGIAIMAMSFNALSYNISSIEVRTSKELMGKMRIEMELGKSFFRDAGEKVLDLTQKVNTVDLDKTENLKNIKYKILLDSNINVEDADVQSAILTGKLNLKGTKNKFKGSNVKRDDLEIITYHKMKADIECENIITANTIGEKLIINLEQFKNLSSCTGDDINNYSLTGIGHRNIAEGRNSYSLEQDKQLGKEFVDQFDAENADKILPENHPMTKFMQAQMEKIAAVSDMPNLKPRVRVINADVLNAFALPGGYVYVFRGLLESAPNLDAVMGVLGHEWAHVTARHGTRGMTRARRTIMLGLGVALVGVVGSEFIDDEKKLLKTVVAGSSIALGLGGAQLYILDRGREQELEADRIGSQYAALAGFAPTGIATMFREFKRLAPRGTATLERLLSSHPHHDERIDKNLIHSSLFYPKVETQNNENILYMNEVINYQDALAQMTSIITPSQYESEDIASAFIETLHAQNEGLLLDDVKEYLENLDEEDTTEEAESE